MNMIRWRVALAAALLLAWPAPSHAQPADIPPDDDTAEFGLVDDNPNVRNTAAQKDSPTSRLLWQRKAWGMVTPSFRETVLREGGHHNFKFKWGPRWVNIGPTGAEYIQNGSFTGHEVDSGRARTVLPHPTNPEIVYFLTSGGGLWRTDNWQSTNTRWRVLTDHLPTTGGGSVAFGRSPNTLYLGLGDPYDQILVGGAMTRTRSGGLLWDEVIELGSAVSVRDVKVDTSTPTDIVLVATDSGLYRSADGGDSYAALATFAGMSVWSIERTSAGWLASAQPCPAAAVGLFCNQPTTLFLSTDLGATWAPVSNAGNVFNANGRTTLGVAAPGDAVVYAFANTVSDGALRDIYRSADGGQTWAANGVGGKTPTNPNATQANMNVCTGQCWYDQMILVDPRDPARNTVWIGGSLSSAKSTDGGATWALFTWWLPNQFPPLPYAHADFHAAAFKTTGTPTLIFGTDGGLNISVDDGVTFSSAKNAGNVSHLFYTVAGNAKYPNLVIGGTQDNGTRLRTDNSSNYNQVIGGDGMGAAYSQDNTNTVMGSSQGSGMRTNFSQNPPEVFQNWVSATSGLSDVGFGFFTAIIPAPPGLDPSGRVFFHFSNARVWRTNNGGLSWIRIGSATAPTSPGLPTTRRFRSSPYNLGVSPTDLGRIAVGAGGGFIDITTDGGASWTDVNLIALVPGYQGFVTNVTWQDDNTLWVTAVAQAAGSVRVIKGTVAPGAAWSTATWTPMQSGLPDLPVTRVLFDPRDASRATIYAATHVGIYRTVDGGASWEPYGVGLPSVRVNDIYMPPDGSFMRIATYGRGIWELPQLELVKAEMDDDVFSCDKDGVVDNGETGRLTITLRNQGLLPVLYATATVTSGNPHVTFPDGNVARFFLLPGRGDRSASVRVAVSGAVGLEAAELQLAVASPELNLPSTLNLTTTHRINYDEKLAGSATESVESANNGWTVAGDPTTRPNVLAWQRRALSPTQTLWWGPNNNGQTDGTRPDGPDEQSIVSPVMRVGTGPLTVSFLHRFAFELGRWDGGVVEVSTDGGATWSDAGGGAYNGVTNAFSSTPIGAGRPAFVERSAGWPGFTPASLNLGTAYAGRDIRLRFRVGADESVGAPGWEIDDIVVNGITDTPFTTLAGETKVCSRRR